MEGERRESWKEEEERQRGLVKGWYLDSIKKQVSIKLLQPTREIDCELMEERDRNIEPIDLSTEIQKQLAQVEEEAAVEIVLS